MRYLNDLKGDIPAKNDDDYIVTRLTLMTLLEPVEDGIQWLTLVEQGYSGWMAARMLKHSDSWLNTIRELCRAALNGEEIPAPRRGRKKR